MHLACGPTCQYIQLCNSHMSLWLSVYTLNAFGMWAHMPVYTARQFTCGPIAGCIYAQCIWHVGPHAGIYGHSIHLWAHLSWYIHSMYLAYGPTCQYILLGNSH